MEQTATNALRRLREIKSITFATDGYHCLECGRCAEVCPEDAIEAQIKRENLHAAA